MFLEAPAPWEAQALSRQTPGSGRGSQPMGGPAAGPPSEPGLSHPPVPPHGRIIGSDSRREGSCKLMKSRCVDHLLSRYNLGDAFPLPGSSCLSSDGNLEHLSFLVRTRSFELCLT